MSWEPELFDEGLWDEPDWEQIVTDNEDEGLPTNATWEERTTHNIQLFLKFMEHKRKKEGPLPAITEGVPLDTKLPESLREGCVSGTGLSYQMHSSAFRWLEGGKERGPGESMQKLA